MEPEPVAPPAHVQCLACGCEITPTVWTTVQPVTPGLSAYVCAACWLQFVRDPIELDG